MFNQHKLVKHNEEELQMNLLTVKDLSLRTNGALKASWLRSAIFLKKIPYIKLGRLIFFEEEEILKWIEAHKINANLKSNEH